MCILVASYGHVSLIVAENSSIEQRCDLIDHTDIALLFSTRGILHGESEPKRGRHSTLSSGSTESQYGLRHINGVPVWNGDIIDSSRL